MVFEKQPQHSQYQSASDLGTSLHNCLEQLAMGQPLTASMRLQLEAMLLSDSMSCTAFEIDPQQTAGVVERRSHLLQALYPTIRTLFSHLDQERFCSTNDLLEALWRLWIPLALQIAECCQNTGRTLVQGILGGQGTGKTTLATTLTVILNHLGYRVCCLSLDDLYKPYAERLQLQQADPRLRWRGPPGTHDIELGLSVLEQLRNADSSQSILIPRFDKSAWNGAGDRAMPETVTDIDVVLFEGWFVGVRPIDPIAFDTAPEPISSDADRTFAQDSNVRLKDYLPLWQQLDRLLVLHPTDYRYSKQWRQQAEHQMIASGRSGMTDEEISRFVSYFWRSLHPELFIKPLLTNPDYVNLVVEINTNHLPGAIYKPLHL